MRYPANPVVRLFISVILLVAVSSCREHRTANPHLAKNYSIYILGKDGKQYIIETDSLTAASGVRYPESQGTELTDQEMDRDIIVKDHSYYHLDRKKALFIKYKIAGAALEPLLKLPIKDFSIENYYWIGKDTLLLTGLNFSKFNQVKYAMVNTGTMKMIRDGEISIMKPSNGFTSMSIGFAERRKNKLYVGYTYHKQLSRSSYTTSDTTFVSTLSYPDMKVLKTAKDTRSTYPGGINTIQSYAFNDESGDYYYMSCPGIALGNRPDLPTAIFRINAGADQPDNNYFFNISGSVIQNHAYGMWYLGSGQAIIRSERKDLYKGLGDHYSTAHFEFFLLDIRNGKVLKKLGLPLDKGTRRECVIVEGDNAYIAVNSTKNGNYIWIYNRQTGTLKKGLKLAGNTDFIMRIDKLNN